MIVLNRLRAARFKQLDDVDLRFPDRATILIEGHNEAGKSSLFEAVLFALYGRPLLAERDYKIADLKQYGAKDMEVALDFSIDGRAFSISRRFGEKHTAKLTTPAQDGAPGETIAILSEIEKRLREELRLSPEALLNTCFVEQKNLERLEDMNPAARQSAINELLNLRILTRLQSEFKVSSEERAELTQHAKRVAIAELDAALPALQARAETARRCEWWTRWRNAEQVANGLQAQIENSERQAQELAQRRAKLEAQREAAARLRERLQTLRDTLTVAAQSWQNAHENATRIAERVEQLQRLQAQLPEREERQREYSHLAQRLAALENLEREIAATALRREQAVAAMEERARLQQAFDAAGEDIARLQDEVAGAQQQLQAAEAVRARRQSAHRREGRLQLWLGQIEKWREAGRRESEIAEQRQHAQETAETLPAATTQLETLQNLRAVRARREAAERAAAETGRELERAKNELAQAEQKAKQRTAAEGERQALEAQLRAAQQAQRDAADKVRLAQTRAALEEWLRAHEEDEHAASLSEESLRAREIDLQNALAAAQEKGALAARAQKPPVVLAALAALILSAVLVVDMTQPVGIMALVLSLALFGASAKFLLSANRAARDAAREYSRLRSEADALVGERRALETQQQSVAQNAARHRARQDEKSRALQALGAPLPASVQGAQAQLAALPSVDFEAARRESAASETALQDARVQLAAAERALQNGGEASATDVAARRARVLELEELFARQQSERAEMIALLKAPGDDESDALEARLDAARARVNAAREAAQALPDLQDAAQKRNAERAAFAAEVSQAARALELPVGDEDGTGEGEFENALARAQREIGEFHNEQQRITDDEVERAVSQARWALGALEARLSVAGAQQAQRRETLGQNSPEKLRADCHLLQEQLQKWDGERAPLVEVREALAAQNLPTTSAEFGAFLAAQEQSLRHARTEVAQLEAAQSEAERHQEKARLIGVQFEELWQRAVPEASAPRDALMALKALPVRAAQIEAELQATDENALLRELGETQTRWGEEQERLARWRQQREVAQTELEKWRCALQGDESCAAMSAQEFPRGDLKSELENALEQSAEQWHDEWLQRREEVSHNRSARGVKAGEIGLDEAPLDLAQEREIHRQAQQRIAVRVRAGEIVEVTRASIVKRVMPLTMQNIRQLLPQLTENRYRDAEWDEAQNRILIYDTRARALVRKHTFSGGARDQISLALRLAFALATLPGEHNIRPGFLFLDEPLSSFDRARTQSLVELLTRGLIRRHFPQIFLISHSESFDPALFDFRLRLENGRVVDGGKMKMEG